MGDLITANKAFIQKVLTGLLTTALMWVNKKYSLGLDPVALAGLGASVILGVAIHAAATSHATITQAGPPVAAPADPLKQ